MKSTVKPADTLTEQSHAMGAKPGPAACRAAAYQNAIDNLSIATGLAA
jgi:hypothetical protein